MKGIDVSQHQGNINWNSVKSQVDFVILRLGWIGNKNNHTLDTKFEEYYAECKRLNIPVGVYVYNYCVREDTARSGAEWTLKKLEGKTLELPVFIDMEDKTGLPLGKDLNTNMCIAFNTVIENAGLKSGVYANLNWFNNYLHKDILKQKYVSWIAHYGVSEDKYKGQYDILQYTSGGTVNGIGGRVDMNIMYDDIIDDRKEKDEDKGGDEPVRVYQNGSTREDIFSDTSCTNKIGSLDPRERCDCFGIFNNRAMVRYRVNGTNNYKIGFARWIGGVK